MIIEKYDIKLRYEGQTYIKMKPINREHLYIIVPLLISNVSKEKEDEHFIDLARKEGYDIAYLYRITFENSEIYGLVIHDEKLEVVD